MNNLGQLIMTGISGKNLTAEEKEFIEKENIGGVLLFSENYESPAQLAELINSIQVLRDEYPLFIAVDHEGGRVQRFKTDFTHFPAALELSKLDSPKSVFHVAKAMATELSACGVNVNFAPVCDILSNPENTVIGDRAFGTSAEEVSMYISSVIRGFQTNGILACAKHFPGHGDTVKDSHYDLPLIKKPLQEIVDNEMNPFVKAIKSRAEFMMMAHLLVEELDPEYPCSLSPKAYEYLRKNLKFTKIAITDDMQMGAITKKYSYEDAAVMAIAAGADMLEYRDMDKAQIALEALKEANKKRDLKNEDIREKYQRIMDTKKQYFQEYKPIYIPEINKNFSQKAHEVFLGEIQKKIDQLKA